MGNPIKKKQQDSSSSSSESNSDSDASSVKEKPKSRRSQSFSEGSDNEKKKESKPEKKEEIKEAINKKHKLDDVQKSKWDSPAENISKNTDRRPEKDTRRKYSDRDENRERKHYDRPKNERNERRDEYKKHDRHEERKYRDEGRNESREEERRYRDEGRDEERRYKEEARDDDRRRDRQNKEEVRGEGRSRARYERRPNEDRHRQDNRRRSRDRSHSRDREDNRRDRHEDFRHRGNKRSKFQNSDEPENYDWGRKKSGDESKPTGDKEKPNFGLSGKLTEDTNTYRGIVIKYSEPSEARKPKRRWRLYPFKGEKALPTLYIHRESAYLMGRERKVVDFPLDHPSCSKQHAVLQYRLVPFTRDNGSVGKRVRPYLIDLDSANGTYINNKRIEARKYYELLEKDVIKFGYSTREYVLLHENSKDEGLDDDVKVEDEEVRVKEEPQE